MKVTLLEACADDLSVVNAARVSFDQSSEWAGYVPLDSPDLYEHDEDVPTQGYLSERDAGLIGFLLRNRHGTPFEHGYLRFHVEAPIFVFREWHRHRVGHSYNEMSARYVEMEDKFYRPEFMRVQEGKPGAYVYREEEDPHLNEVCKRAMDVSYSQSWKAYQALLDAGIAKEQARAVLPVGIYTQMYWSCNPRSLMHFLSLRNAETAQKEIRDLAAQAEQIFEQLMPVTAAAFVNNGRLAP